MIRIGTPDQFGRPQSVDDPTPDEIRKSCEEIRKGWTSLDKKYRGGEPVAWSVPMVSVTDVGVGIVNELAAEAGECGAKTTMD